jgi:tetratricopeptide (TPR) repeat protein
VATNGDAFAARDGVARLTDKSLLVHGFDPGGSRWHMLATMRAYAREQLDASGELPETRRRHLSWAVGTAREIEQALDDDGGWQVDFDAVADDLRAARGAADAQGERGDDGFELAYTLGHLTYARRFLVEAHEHYASAVRLAPGDGAAVRALRDAAAAALAELRGEAAFELLIRASERAGKAGDARGAAIALADAATIAGRMPATFEHRLTSEAVDALVAEARATTPADDVEVVARVTLATAFAGFCGAAGIDPKVADEALLLTRQLDDPVLISGALDAVALAMTASGSHKAASRITAERVALLDRLPRHDPRSGGEVADIYYIGSQAALAVGELDVAVANGRRAYEDSINRQGLTHFAAAHLVVPLMLQGAFDQALSHAAVMQRGWDRTGRPVAGWMATSFYAAALVCALRGDEPAYRQWWDLAEQLSVNSNSSRSFRHFARTRIAMHRGDLHSDSALTAPVPTSQAPHFDAYAGALATEAAVVAHRPDPDGRIAAALPLARDNDYAAAYLARAAGRLHGSEEELERALALWNAMDARFEVACTLLLMRGRAAQGRRELKSLGCVGPLP